MNRCPCDASLVFEQCCGRFIVAGDRASTPEALMRSRYTAYTLADIAYIGKTQAGSAAVGFDPVSAKQWAMQAHWLGLEVLRAWNESKKVAFVEFEARYQMNFQLETIHEVSRFERIKGAWFYV